MNNNVLAYFYCITQWKQILTTFFNIHVKYFGAARLKPSCRYTHILKCLGRYDQISMGRDESENHERGRTTALKYLMTSSTILSISSVYRSIYLLSLTSVYLSVYLSILSSKLSIFLSCLSICLSIDLIFKTIYLSIYRSCLQNYPSFYLIYLSVYLFIYLSIFLSSLKNYPSIYLVSLTSVYLSCLPNFCLSILSP